MVSQRFPGDASTLIYIAKADAFTEVARCVDGIVVVPSIWRESVEAGEQIGAPEVARIRSAVDAGFLERVALPADVEAEADRIAAESRLGRGESEVLAVALAGERLAIVDEGRASRVAAAMGIVVLSTLLLAVVGLRSSRMRHDEARALLRRLAVASGARADVVFRVERELSGGEHDED